MTYETYRIIARVDVVQVYKACQHCGRLTGRILLRLTGQSIVCGCDVDPVCQMLVKERLGGRIGNGSDPAFPVQFCICMTGV